jgi:hypothetical protein
MGSVLEPLIPAPRRPSHCDFRQAIGAYDAWSAPSGPELSTNCSGFRLRVAFVRRMSAGDPGCLSFGMRGGSAKRQRIANRRGAPDAGLHCGATEHDSRARESVGGNPWGERAKRSQARAFRVVPSSSPAHRCGSQQLKPVGTAAILPSGRTAFGGQCRRHSVAQYRPRRATRRQRTQGDLACGAILMRQPDRDDGVRSDRADARAREPRS